ncbi:hypothetical protein [Chryseobacterium sp. BIGb0232]|uniref:hypothetical protein n=1 Tax=Chryseobacterium sp. BIGb0232 TaxID=2940598 RepID=UPI000F475699|nr:hypothetical protein [Chryseobacterium sp. BIGb0232]MCS4304103.1 hypothetical protein [Chryseobacterium sp. BIGb0232]ROS17682.1 hypothetical protein EDF65_2063 [Chryseobacterium nakagawai]
MKNELDKEALNILLEYSYSKEKDKEYIDRTKYAESKGFWLKGPKDNSIDHDTFLETIFKDYKNINKVKCIDLFISSISKNRMDYRVGLGAMAIMKTFPDHSLYSKSDGITVKQYKKEKMSDLTINCSICNSSIMQPSLLNGNLSYLYHWGGGRIMNLTALYLCFYVANKLEEDKPTKEDFEIFANILDLILSCEETDTPNILDKKLRQSKLLKKENEEQRRSFLGLLGYCGILHSENHKGSFYEYNDSQLGAPPRKSRNSDWSYPIDYWTGKDGIDKDAFRFWFGEYKELERFWK